MHILMFTFTFNSVEYVSDQTAIHRNNPITIPWSYRLE